MSYSHGEEVKACQGAKYIRTIYTVACLWACSFANQCLLLVRPRPMMTCCCAHGKCPVHDGIPCLGFAYHFFPIMTSTPIQAVCFQSEHYPAEVVSSSLGGTSWSGWSENAVRRISRCWNWAAGARGRPGGDPGELYAPPFPQARFWWWTSVFFLHCLSFLDVSLY